MRWGLRGEGRWGVGVGGVDGRGGEGGGGEGGVDGLCVVGDK